MASSSALLDPSIFAYLEAAASAEAQVRDALDQTVKRLDRAVGVAQGLLSRVHMTPRSRYAELVAQVEAAVRDEVAVVKELDELASQHPFYKYNSKWTRSVQGAMGTAIYCAWLGGFPPVGAAGQVGRLVTMEELGAIFCVPTCLKDRDAFHLTLEEYLLALTGLSHDLSRLATNAVTHGDTDLPLVIIAFVRDLFAGFQLLHLKNDILRKRADAVKYDVKRVEDILYDLALKGLDAKPAAVDADMRTEA